MRAGIGLIGLLVGVALMVWLFAQTEIPKAKAGKQAQEQVRQISGRGADDAPAEHSFKTEAQHGGSRMSLLVTDVIPGGAMQTYYGLLKDDRITAVNGMNVNDIAVGNEDLAHALVAEAFGRQQPLTVVRNGQTVTLPAPPGSLPAGGAATAPAAGQAPAPAPQEGQSVYDQLQRIQDTAGGAGEE